MKKILILLIGVLLMGIVSADFKTDIKLSDQLISLKINPGDSSKEIINIFNEGKVRNIRLVDNYNRDFIKVGNEGKESKSREYISLEIEFLGNNRGVFFGEIELIDVYSGEYIKIPYSVIVADERSKFDLIIDVPQNSLIKNIGDDISFDVRVLNQRGTLNNAVLNVEFLDLNGVLSNVNEVVSVNLGNSETKRISFQTQDLDEGLYLISASVAQSDFNAKTVFVNLIDSKNLSPIINEIDYSNYIYFSIFSFLIVSVFILSYYWNKRVKSEAKDWRGQINILKKVKFGNVGRMLRKLKHQKIVLGTALENNFISKNSYNKGIRELDIMIKKAEKKL